MLTIGLKLDGLDKVRKELAALTGPQMRGAYAKAINDTAFQVRREMQREMQARFDRPTSFITRSPKVFQATPDQLEATIAPTYQTALGSKGGKIGVDPQQVLQAQEFGGMRRDKRSEVALRRAGILPPGWQTAIPDESRGGPFPGSDDGMGNLKGPFLRSVLSFLQTYQSGQGYTQNMSGPAKDRMRKFGRATISKAAQRQAGPFMGRRYFISYGENASPYGAGVIRTDAGLKYGKTHSAHIGPGIWATLGTGKSARIRAVLIFIKPSKGYRPRLDLQSIATSQATTDYLARRMRFRIREAAGV